jgi:hypothetical protein
MKTSFLKIEKEIIKISNLNNAVVAYLTIILDDFIQNTNLSSSELNKIVNFNLKLYF